MFWKRERKDLEKFQAVSSSLSIAVKCVMSSSLAAGGYLTFFSRMTILSLTFLIRAELL